MTDAILDTSAVLALVRGEPGHAIVSRLVASAIVCSVNEAEVITTLIRNGQSVDEANQTTGQLPYRVADADRELARAAGALFDRTRELGLSLGDRFCLALAERERLPVYTADRPWSRLAIGIDIRLIRP